jgi:hypothetical protein
MPFFSLKTPNFYTRGRDNMKMFWIAAMTAGLLTLSANAQTSPAAGASASQSAQSPATSTNVNGSANTRVSQSSDQQGTDKGSPSSASASGNTSAEANTSTGTLSTGTLLQAELAKSIDAKKAKPGDEVTARLMQDVRTGGNATLHKGSRLVGHVTEAQAKSKENAESRLGVVFDKAVLKGGQEVAFVGVIQALAPPVQGTLPVAGDDGGNLGSGMGSGNGGSMGGGRSGGGAPAPMGGAGNNASPALGSINNTAGSVTNSANGAVNGIHQTAGAAANGTINSTTRGVVGMQGIALSTAANSGAQGSVLSSASRNVKLDSGTQMILQVAAPAAGK